MNISEKAFNQLLKTNKAIKDAKIALYSNLSLKALQNVAKNKGIKLSFYGHKLSKSELVTELLK